MDNKKIVITTIIILGLIIIGVTWYYKKETVSAPASLTASSTSESNQYLVVNEWSIKLQEPTDMSFTYAMDPNFTATVMSSSSEFISLGLPELAQLDPINCKGDFGHLGRSQTLPKTPEGILIPSSSVVWVNGSYYWFIGPQAPCSNKAQGVQLESKAATYIGTNLKSIILPISG